MLVCDPQPSCSVVCGKGARGAGAQRSSLFRKRASVCLPPPTSVLLLAHPRTSAGANDENRDDQGQHGRPPRADGPRVNAMRTLLRGVGERKCHFT